MRKHDTSATLLGSLLLPLMAIYSVLVIVVYPSLILLSRFSKAIRYQLQGRKLFKVVDSRPSKKRRNYIVFCSSAGEYEQARPIIDRFAAQQFEAFIVFFSKSGFDYARARKEHNFYTLAPADNIFSWYYLLRQISPDFAIVVRHELWPAFLYTMLFYGPVFLINFSRHQASSFWSKLNYGLLQLIRIVFAVESTDVNTKLSLGPNRWQVAGETKYDRVWDRAHAESNLGTFLELGAIFGDRKILVLGSAWIQDVTVILDAVNRLKESAKKKLAIVVVPHDVSKNNIDLICSALMEGGLKPQLYSTSVRSELDSSSVPVLVVDQIGILFNIYSQSDFCWVGGAVHHRVHNVLEPAVFNLSLAFGPLFQSQREAIHLVEAGIAKVCDNPDAVANWLQSCIAPRELLPQSIDFIKAKLGASDRIVRCIQQEVLDAR